MTTNPLRRARVHSLLCATALATSLIAGAGGAATAATDDGTAYYLDSSAPAGGDGSAAHPWNDLAQANAHTFGPGDQLLLHRGRTFTGTLAPQGSGAAGEPLVIAPYGGGSARPHIDGGGNPDAVLLDNIEYVEVTGLEITNAEDPGTQRTGIRLWLHDFGTGHHYVISNNDIHDVHGDDNKAMTGSEAVMVSVTGTAVPTWYDGVRITHNTVSDVEREGIYFKSTWSNRPLVGQQQDPTVYPGDWTPSLHVSVDHNTLRSIGGDAIKIDTTSGAVVSYNTVAGFQLRSKVANAGIWTFNTDDTLVSHNDVSGGGNHTDGMSYDADGASNHTVFEDNLSHDNAGGFMLICPYAGAKTINTVIRNNTSTNDQYRVIQTCPGEIRNTQITDNTFRWTTTVPTYLLEGGASTGVVQELAFRRNAFIKADSLPDGGLVSTGHISDLVWEDNTLHNVTPPYGME